jgi:pimeloyl-ACP methyl ester carboxylesterase
VPYFGYFYDLLSATPGVPEAEVRKEQAAAYAAPSALTASFGWYRAFDRDIEDNTAAAAGPPVRTPLLYLRGGAERGGSIDAYVGGLRRAGVIDVRPAVISGTGHFPHDEAAAATWRAISGFISSATSHGQLATPEPDVRKDPS